MKYSLLSQPFCLRMWLCWTPLFLPVKKEQLGARLSWREKNYWGFDIQRFSDGYPRSLHPRYLACFSASGADGFHLDHRAWSCWRVSINASCRPMYFGAWLGGEFAGVDEWCNTLPAMAFAYFWCVLMLIVFAALKANTEDVGLLHCTCTSQYDPIWTCIIYKVFIDILHILSVSLCCVCFLAFKHLLRDTCGKSTFQNVSTCI